MANLSAGVYTEDYKLSYARHRSLPIRGAFVGNFQKGPVHKAVAITSIDEFIEVFGLPTDKNYNDWYQVHNFLQYHNGIYVARAANLDLDFEPVTEIPADITVTTDEEITSFDLNNNPYNFTEEQKALLKSFKLYDRFTVEGDNAESQKVYTVTDPSTFSFVPKLKRSIFSGEKILKLQGVTTASVEVPTDKQFRSIPADKPNGIPANAVVIDNADTFNLSKDDIPNNNFKTPLTIYARSPGTWGNHISVAIVKPSDFKINYSVSDDRNARLCFEGVVVDNVFRKVPLAHQVGIVVALGNRVVETWVVSTTRKESNNDYIEDIINNRSSYILVKRGIGELYSTCFDVSDIHRPLRLLGGKDSDVRVDDIAKATHIFDDKDTYQFDVMIGNELDEGMSASTLAITRQDIVAVIGASFDNFRTREHVRIIDNLVQWRNAVYTAEGCPCTRDSSNPSLKVLKTSYVVFVGNYYIIFDKYNNKQRLINLAGDIAGLRAWTNENFAEWYASAGYNRGILRTDGQLFFNPTKAHRDVLYNNNINPVFAESSTGNVMFGNRTLDDLESNFLSWHVRSMTNMLQRSLEALLRQFLLEPINDFTMNSVVSSIQPLLQRVQVGNGIEQYYIVCDGSNNTPETRYSNELHVDVFFKPTGVAEYIRLRLVNTGEENFMEVVDRVRFS